VTLNNNNMGLFRKKSDSSSVTATDNDNRHQALDHDEKKIESKRGSDGQLGPQRSASISEGEAKYKRLGWKKLTICLIVEAIALGSLSIPSVFAETGLVAGVLLCIGLGLIAIYTSYLVRGLINHT
jgi:hypothetical protein